MPSPTSLTAFVLAGGRSTRMGSDKAFMQLGGQSLLAHALALAQSVTDQVKIVGDPGKFATFGKVIPDIYSARGPLGGIHAALHDSETDCNFILGVDIPFLQPGFVSCLASEAQSSDAIVTVPSTGGYLQPLCGIYRKEFLVPAEAALAAGRNKIDALFSSISVRVIDEQEIVRAGFNPSMFRNLNTPEDWEAAKRKLEFRAEHL